jgi:DNA-binding NtrC family response regulator
MEKRRILAVDDEELILWSLATYLSKAGFEVETAVSAAAAREKFQSFRPEMVLLDLRLPDGNGMELLHEFREAEDDLAIIMMTADAHAETAVQALQLGADDFIGKPFNMETVKHTLHQVLENKRLKKQVDSLRRGLRKKTATDQLIGNSPRMIELLKMVHGCARNDCRTVLLLGESGTGKELVARAIHNYSARVDEPFFDINCSAIPENLLENELFGHEKGAFTDASDRQKGIFELADGGTVFLDEIGDMPLAMQAKILRVIETKRFRRLGGKEELHANVRIISATNQDLPAMVRDGKFRGDLFYRLNVMTLDLPPLRERKEDIPKIVDYFINRLNEEYGRTIEGITPVALEVLEGHGWPGNVRELRNVVERAMMLEHGRFITTSFFPSDIRHHESAPEPLAEEAGTTVKKLPVVAKSQSQSHKIVLPPGGISIEEVEKELIRQALERYEGHQVKAARSLGMSRDTLRYRMKKFGFSDDEPEAPASPPPRSSGRLASAS